MYVSVCVCVIIYLILPLQLYLLLQRLSFSMSENVMCFCRALGSGLAYSFNTIHKPSTLGLHHLLPVAFPDHSTGSTRSWGLPGWTIFFFFIA